MSIIPEQDEDRAKVRLLDYMMGYFPNAQVAKARHSYESNIKHNGGEGMEWAKDKSVGDGNQIMRHLVDGMEAWRNGNQDEATYHFTCLAWRGDELLERMLNNMPPFRITNETLTLDPDHVEDVYQARLAEERRLKRPKPTFNDFLDVGTGGMGEGDQGVPWSSLPQSR